MRPIRSGRAVRIEGGPAPREDAAAPEKQGVKYDFKQVGVGLAVVIAAILALRLVGKRVLAFPGANKLSNSVVVVMRTPVGPRQHLMLVRVGKRLWAVRSRRSAVGDGRLGAGDRRWAMGDGR